MKNSILLGMFLLLITSLTTLKVLDPSTNESQSLSNMSTTSAFPYQGNTQLDTHLNKKTGSRKAELLSTDNHAPSPDELYELRLKTKTNDTEVPATMPTRDVIPDELAELETNYASNKSSPNYLNFQNIQSDALAEGILSYTDMPPSEIQNQVIPYELELLENDSSKLLDDRNGEYRQLLWDNPFTATMLDPS